MDSLLFHPKVVHLPIALGLLMPLLAGGVLLAWHRGWLQPRTWILVAALQTALVGSGVVALQTGEKEEERVERVVGEQAMEAHEESAETFVWGSGVVLGLMLLPLVLPGDRIKLSTGALATLGALVVLGLGYRTGEAGGRLVYEHGAAQVYVSANGSGTGVRSTAPEGHDSEDDDD